MNHRETSNNIEPYIYIKKQNNIHYLIHTIIDSTNYVKKISENVYNSLMFYEVIKNPEEIILIYETDPFKELGNIICIKHMNNEIEYIYDIKELKLIFLDLIKNTFVDEMYVLSYGYQNEDYYFGKTMTFNKMLNTNTKIRKFLINNVNYSVCVRPFKK